MEWFNASGLVFIVAIMIPNIIYAIKCKDGFENKWKNKPVEMIEQVGRFGCFAFMIVNIPGTCFGWGSNIAFTVYLIVNSLMVALYCVFWAVMWHKNSIFKALALSVIPATVFLFSGIMSRSILLTLATLLFAPTHILISYKNATAPGG